MRRTLVVLSALALVMASATVVVAQAPPGGGGGGGGRGGFGGGRFGGGGGLGMLRMKEVQKELNMTDHQISVLDAKQQEVQGAMQDLRQGVDFQSMTPEDRQKLQAKMQAIQTKAVSDVLDTKQMVRYHQLELQQQGLGSVTRNKELATKLGLTDDQTKQIADIQQKAQEEMRASMQAAGGPQAFQSMTPEDRQKLFAKMADSRKATEAKMVEVLTDKQQATWKEMTGPHFDFPAFGGFGGRRPGGPPPGQ